MAFVKYSGVAEERGRGGRGPSVGSLEIVGPYDGAVPDATPSRDRIFTCRPDTAEDEATCAREVLSSLARRAFRRPVTQADVDTLIGFYEAGRLEGSFDQGIQVALERVLVDPEFLFRIERDPDGLSVGAVYPLSDIELASRLSFFLWSSIPDDELLAVAERGDLKVPEVLDAQVRRMLADPRASAMVDNFASQWLLVRNVRFAEPDRALFPRFDGNLKEALARETELFLEDQFRHDNGVLDLLSADYTFVNSRLAEHYVRDPECVRESFSPRDVGGRAPARAAWPRQRVDRDLVPQPDIGRVARQVGAGESVRGTPTTRRPIARRERERRETEVPA